MSDEVKHFGVKGMHWGVRRAEKAEARVNANVASGMSLVQARQAEAERKQKIRKWAITGAAVAVLYAPTLLAYGRVGAQGAANNYVNKKTAQAGAKAAANLMADKRGLANYKIVDVAFDAASGQWK